MLATKPNPNPPSSRHISSKPVKHWTLLGILALTGLLTAACSHVSTPPADIAVQAGTTTAIAASVAVTVAEPAPAETTSPLTAESLPRTGTTGEYEGLHVDCELCALIGKDEPDVDLSEPKEDSEALHNIFADLELFQNVEWDEILNAGCPVLTINQPEIEDEPEDDDRGHAIAELAGELAVLFPELTEPQIKALAEAYYLCDLTAQDAQAVLYQEWLGEQYRLYVAGLKSDTYRDFVEASRWRACEVPIPGFEQLASIDWEGIKPVLLTSAVELAAQLLFKPTEAEIEAIVEGLVAELWQDLIGVWAVDPEIGIGESDTDEYVLAGCEINMELLGAVVANFLILAPDDQDEGNLDRSTLFPADSLMPVYPDDEAILSELLEWLEPNLAEQSQLLDDWLAEYLLEPDMPDSTAYRIPSVTSAIDTLPA